MTKNILLETLVKIVSIAQDRKIKIVIMGGLATSVYSPPRATFDIDCIANIDEEGLFDFLGALYKKGFTYDKENPIKIIQGLPFVTLYYSKFKVYVDLFLARSDFQIQIVNRSRSVKVDALRLNIISPEDLVLVKLLTGRSKDTEDIRQILVENADKLDFEYLNRCSNNLGVNVFLQDEMNSLRINFPKSQSRGKQG